MAKQGEGSGATDRRIARSKEVVLQTTTRLLVECGVSGLSVDEVSRQSGVAKTTIYRHWRTRTDLVRDGCAALATPQRTPDTGSLRGDLLALVFELAEALEAAPWASVLPSMADAALRDPDLDGLLTRTQAAYTAPYREVIQRSQIDGTVSADLEPQVLVAQLVGPLFYRRWFSREPMPESFLTGLVDAAIAWLTRGGPPPGP